MPGQPSRRIWTLLAAILAGGLALGLAWSGEIPRWRWGGALMMAHQPLPGLGSLRFDVHARRSLVLRGDSNTRGSRIGRDEPSFATLLGRLAEPGASVEVLAAGGVTAEEGRDLWPSRGAVQVCVLAFGSNDAAPRGVFSRRQAQGTERYARALTVLVEQCRERSAQVLILAPWPSGSQAMERRIAPYRDAARETARRLNVAFRDPMEAFVGHGEEVLLLPDALHLNGRAHRLVARWMARLLQLPADNQYTAPAGARAALRLNVRS